ncbi:MAG: TIGR01459 family HAD-type hydrolase [Siphonobacter sp.]
MKLDDFKTVISNYKVIFFDAFGVLKNYKGLIPGIEHTFQYLKEQKIDYYILTNDASRSPRQLADSYHRLGVKDVTPRSIISSGLLAQEFLIQKVREGTIAYLGPRDSASYLETGAFQPLSIRDLDLDQCDDVNALVFLDDEGFDWRMDLNKAVNLLRKRNIPVIVANTDTTYPVSKNQVALAIGGIAEMVEAAVGKQFIRFGKPETQIFSYAYEYIRKKLHVAKKDILMVGDTLNTDILGGNKFGLDTALVLSGNTRSEDVETRISTSGIIPTYICESAVIN